TAPARGKSSARMPNSRDATPLSASSHSWEMYWRRRIAATISSAPVTRAQAAMRYTSARAVIPGKMAVTAAAAIPTMPSKMSAPQRSCVRAAFHAGFDKRCRDEHRHHLVYVQVFGAHRMVFAQLLHLANERIHA